MPEEETRRGGSERRLGEEAREETRDARGLSKLRNTLRVSHPAGYLGSAAVSQTQQRWDDKWPVPLCERPSPEKVRSEWKRRSRLVWPCRILPRSWAYHRPRYDEPPYGMRRDARAGTYLLRTSWYPGRQITANTVNKLSRAPSPRKTDFVLSNQWAALTWCEEALPGAVRRGR